MRDANAIRMIVLIVLFVLLFLLLLLATPVVVTAHARFSPAGGVVHAALHLFGVVPIPLRLRIRLLSEPYLTLRVFGRTHGLLAKKRRAPPSRRAFRLERIDLSLTLGLPDDSAGTVRCLGIYRVLASMLLPVFCAQNSIAAHASFAHPMLRVRLHVVALVFPLFLLLPKKPRIRSGPFGQPNRSNKQEKRYSHVPC